VEVILLTFGLVFGSIYSLTTVILDRKHGDYDLEASRVFEKLRQRTDGGIGPSRF
jgi:hypothetical protein